MKTWYWRLYGKRHWLSHPKLSCRAVTWFWNVNWFSANGATKNGGHAKRFSPNSPLRTPLSPFPKNKVCNPSLGGQGANLFTQHYSCPAVFRCLLGSTVGGFFGLFFCVWQIVAFNRTGTRPALIQAVGYIRVAHIVLRGPLGPLSPTAASGWMILKMAH